METLTMKMTEKSFYDLTSQDPPGPMMYAFTFRDFDYTHQPILILGNGDGEDPRAQQNPLYDLQGVEVGTMVELNFDLVQQRNQKSRDGRKDQVKDVVGLELVSIEVLGTPAAGSFSSGSGGES